MDGELARMAEQQTRIHTLLEEPSSLRFLNFFASAAATVRSDLESFQHVYQQPCEIGWVDFFKVNYRKTTDSIQLCGRVILGLLFSTFVVT